MIFLVACQTSTIDPAELAGRWKIYRANYAGKDVSKSSDPFFWNGMEFEADGTYRQFGHETYRDTGTYVLEADRIHIYTNGDTLWGTIRHQGDSLWLSFPMEENQHLKIDLYRL